MAPMVRMYLFRMLERKLPDLTVLSYAEVDDDVPMEILGTINAEPVVEEAVSS